MKIGLVCPYNIFRGGGVQEGVLAIKDELIKRGHQAIIITPRPRNVSIAETDGIVLIGSSTDVKSLFHTTAQVSVSVDGAELDALLEKEKFDVLHFHEPWVPILSRQILGRSETANVATFHAKLPETMMAKTIEKVITPYTKSVLKSLHTLTAVSEAAKEYVTSLTDDSIHIIPNGIDAKRFAPPTSVKSRPNTILYVGRLERRKGVKYLLKAFAVLKNNFPDAELIIAGDGPDKDKLESYVSDNKIRGVQFEGYVDNETKIRFMQECAVFCSPAPYGESFGIVLLEAMASGAVVVAANNPGYRAVLAETGRISLVSPKDAQEFAMRLQLMLEDEPLRDAWKKWAKTYIERFSYDKIVDQYEVLYKQAIKQHKH